MAALLGLQLTDKPVEQAGLVFHYGLGMSWGTVYTLLHRLTPLPPAVAGLLTGASLSLLIDEGLTPLPGTSRAEPRLPALDACARLRCAPGVWLERGRSSGRDRRAWTQEQGKRRLTRHPSPVSCHAGGEARAKEYVPPGHPEKTTSSFRQERCAKLTEQLREGSIC